MKKKRWFLGLWILLGMVAVGLTFANYDYVMKKKTPIWTVLGLKDSSVGQLTSGMRDDIVKAIEDIDLRLKVLESSPTTPPSGDPTYVCKGFYQKEIEVFVPTSTAEMKVCARGTQLDPYSWMKSLTPECCEGGLVPSGCMDAQSSTPFRLVVDPTSKRTISTAGNKTSVTLCTTPASRSVPCAYACASNQNADNGKYCTSTKVLQPTSCEELSLTETVDKQARCEKNPWCSWVLK